MSNANKITEYLALLASEGRAYNKQEIKDDFKKTWSKTYKMKQQATKNRVGWTLY